MHIIISSIVLNRAPFLSFFSFASMHKMCKENWTKPQCSIFGRKGETNVSKFRLCKNAIMIMRFLMHFGDFFFQSIERAPKHWSIYCTHFWTKIENSASPWFHLRTLYLVMETRYARMIRLSIPIHTMHEFEKKNEENYV